MSGHSGPSPTALGGQGRYSWEQLERRGEERGLLLPSKGMLRKWKSNTLLTGRDNMSLLPESSALLLESVAED